MHQMEAVRKLVCEEGISSEQHLKTFMCGSTDNPEKTRRVLTLAEIAWPEIFRDIKPAEKTPS